jgi:predicted RNase H-like HicB family nuclease
MEKKKYIYFFDNDMWIGYWQEFPDYMTQGKTLEELQMNLKDIYQDLTSGSIPCVRHVGEMEVA